MFLCSTGLDNSVLGGTNHPLFTVILKEKESNHMWLDP